MIESDIFLSKLYCFKNNNIPKGTIIIDIIFITFFKVFIITELTFFIYLASCVILEA